MEDNQNSGKSVHRVYIENLGCAKNQVDAEVMLQYLQDTGEWVYTDDASAAEVILVNTCGFIESAREESIQALMEFRSSYPDAEVIMTGCLAERYAETISEELYEADGFMGNRDLSRITEVVRAAAAGERRVELPRSFRQDEPYRERLFSFPSSAYLKISEGCDHRCRYCAIPVIRGGLRSRSADDVVREVEDLVRRGIYEINVIAQDLAAFGTDRSPEEGGLNERGSSEFMSLLQHLCDIPGDFIIRMLYIHPDAFPRALPEFVADHPKIVPYFDIPLQHVSVPVLRGMGRRGDYESYLELIRSIRAKVPNSIIRSTFMLGFTGDGKTPEQELADFLAEAQLDWVGFFIYSREEDTPAFSDRSEKAHRKAVKRAEEFLPAVQELQQGISEARMDRWIGEDMDVLIEEIIPDEDLAIGRSFLQAPEVDGCTVVNTDRAEPGDVLRCRVFRRNGIDLEARDFGGPLRKAPGNSGISGIASVKDHPADDPEKIDPEKADPGKIDPETHGKTAGNAENPKNKDTKTTETAKNAETAENTDTKSAEDAGGRRK